MVEPTGTIPAASDTTQQKTFEAEQSLLKALYKFLELGHESKDMSAKRIGKLTGVGDRASSFVANFDDLGILSRRMEYGTPANGMGPGRHWHWTPLVDEGEALRLLRANQTARGASAIENREQARLGAIGKPKPQKPRTRAPEAATFIPTPVVAKAGDGEEVRAIAGEERNEHLGDLMSSTIRNLRKDDAAALIEAARQYSNRTSVFRTKIDELAAMAAEIGVTFDKDKALDSIQLDTDERLEAVVPLLPYVTRLEQTIERMGQQLVSQSGKVRDYDSMVTENRRLKNRLEQLISARAMSLSGNASAANESR